MNSRPVRLRDFDEGYKLACFYQWYSAGKPAPIKFHQMAQPDREGRSPALKTINKWYKDWVVQAEELDQQARDVLNATVVAEKVEMLKRHGKIAKEMQQMAINALEEEHTVLKASDAIRLLVESMRIERESVGIPGAIEKIMEKSDEDLLLDITKLLDKGTLAPMEQEE